MPFTELEKRIAELERVTAQSLVEPREGEDPSKPVGESDVLE
jgi:hypothetical protein